MPEKTRPRVRKIAEKLISDSFPDLKGKKILFIIIWFRFFGLSFLIPPSLRVIILSRRTRFFSDEILTGILAHELCHQERYLRMTIPGYLKFVVKYLFSNSARTDEERSTDRLAIEKGYGKQLFELTLISHRDSKHKSILDNYLTPDEIKRYSMELGKWYI